jgi:hypothetical protein
MFLNQTGIYNGKFKNTIPNSVYKQLLYVPVRAYKVSFPTNMIGPGQLLKAGVSGCNTAMVHATAHTRDRCDQF